MIHTLTLNPAIDKVIFLERLEKNITNRPTRIVDTLGGKGTHVSINLSLLQVQNRAYGVAFGDTGRSVIRILEEHGVETRFIHRDDANTRTNFLLIEDTSDCTIIADRGVRLDAAVLDELMKRLEQELREGDYLILSGDASNCDSDIYKEILERLRAKRLKVFLDASGGSLQRCLEVPLFLIKPNLDELSTLCGRPLLAQADILTALEDLHRCYEVQVIAVSLGGQGSLVKCPEGIFQVASPKVRVRNTIGCGDCFLSGLVYGYSKDLPITETLRIATAIAAATAESDLSVGFDPKRAEQLIEEVVVNPLQTAPMHQNRMQTGNFKLEAML